MLPVASSTPHRRALGSGQPDSCGPSYMQHYENDVGDDGLRLTLLPCYPATQAPRILDVYKDMGISRQGRVAHCFQLCILKTSVDSLALTGRRQSRRAASSSSSSIQSVKVVAQDSPIYRTIHSAQPQAHNDSRPLGTAN